MSNGNGRRIIGNTTTDEVIGRLLERTETIQDQSVLMENTLNLTNGTLSKLNETIVRMQVMVEHIIEDYEQHIRDSKENDHNHSTRMARVETRILIVEGWKSDVQFVSELRAKLNKTIIGIIVAALLLAIASWLAHGIAFR